MTCCRDLMLMPLLFMAHKSANLLTVPVEAKVKIHLPKAYRQELQSGSYLHLPTTENQQDRWQVK